MDRKALIKILLVPESKDVTHKKLAEEIKETLRCAWLQNIVSVNIEDSKDVDSPTTP